MSELNDFDAQRRRILRRITLLTWGLWGAVALVAVVAGALLAWMFRGVAGLSFVTLWLLIALALVALPAAIHLVMGGAARRRGAGDEDQ